MQIINISQVMTCRLLEVSSQLIAFPLEIVVDFLKNDQIGHSMKKLVVEHLSATLPTHHASWLVSAVCKWHLWALDQPKNNCSYHAGWSKCLVVSHVQRHIISWCGPYNQNLIDNGWSVLYYRKIFSSICKPMLTMFSTELPLRVIVDTIMDVLEDLGM